MTGWDAAASRVLRHYALGEIRHVDDLATCGGFSDSRLFRVASAAGLFALKRLPLETDVERIQYVHRVLSLVRDAGCRFVAAPQRDILGATLVSSDGYTWEVSPWMPGQADFNDRPSGERLQSAMTAVAEFHNAAARIHLSHAVSPSIRERVAKLETYVNRSEFHCCRLPSESLPHVELLRTGLKMAPHLANQLLRRIPPGASAALPLHPVIRDLWHAHVLFSDERVTGIIDFHALRVDTPLLDLARLVGSFKIDGRSPWREAMEGYLRWAALPANALPTIRWLHACNVVLGLVHWAQWLTVERRVFSNAVGVQSRLETLVTELANGCELT